MLNLLFPKSTIGLVLVVVSASFCLFFLLRRIYLRATLRRRAEKVANRIADYERRVSLIEVHAMDYVNSLQGDDSRALYEIRQLIASANFMVQEVNSLIDSGSYFARKEALKLLNNRFPKREPEGSGFALPTTVGFPKTPQWEQRIEYLLQRVGGGVSSASIAYKGSGLKGRSQRGPTLMDLVDAGVETLRLERTGKKQAGKKEERKDTRDK